jgi:hypothetical protein
VRIAAGAAFRQHIFCFLDVSYYAALRQGDDAGCAAADLDGNGDLEETASFMTLF